jgi:CIC family chloride channel protein
VMTYNISKDAESKAEEREKLEASLEEALRAAIEHTNNIVVGVLSYGDIISSYKQHFDENETAITHISLKRQRMKMVLKGKTIFKKSAEK